MTKNRLRTKNRSTLYKKINLSVVDVLDYLSGRRGAAKNIYFYSYVLCILVEGRREGEGGGEQGGREMGGGTMIKEN